MSDIEYTVARAVSRDFAGHRLIVQLDQGLHRHLVFEQRENSWNNRFELITATITLRTVAVAGGVL